VTRRRRAAVLLGLAGTLGTLSATHMSRREAALRAQVGPTVEVVVARSDLKAGQVLELSDLGLRALPARYAPGGPPAFPGAQAGHRLAVPVLAGSQVTPELLQREPQTPASLIKRGERAVDVVASGSVAAGARVDVMATTEKATRVLMQDVEVLAAKPAAAGKEDSGPRVLATLRVSAREAIYLVAAQSFARDVRLLARAPGDQRVTEEVVVGEGL
jgi:pilus assembly protein CpaB